ncbi:MAG: hypothetical protein BWZ03_00099 [bacterium ADurb.BinA186]|nr:MAG: hypothetical protein BWZ03_00099 [bacterium ADurb.BinA186]
MSTSRPYGKRINRNKKPEGFEIDKEEITFERKAIDPKYRSIAEKLALHRIYMRNVVIDELKKAFPLKHQMWTISKVFPYAQGGKLFVDEPNGPYEMGISSAKEKVLRDLKFRLVVLKPMTTLEEAQQDLWEIDQGLVEIKGAANVMDNSNSGLQNASQ